LGWSRSSVRYRTRRGTDLRLRGLLRELAQRRPRFGYRRLCGSCCVARASASIQSACIEPGKPTQNSHIESFNGRLRDECLNQNLRWPTFRALGMRQVNGVLYEAVQWCRMAKPMFNIVEWRPDGLGMRFHPASSARQAKRALAALT
jgi:hypothetical protein